MGPKSKSKGSEKAPLEQSGRTVMQCIQAEVSGTMLSDDTSVGITDVVNKIMCSSTFLETVIERVIEKVIVRLHDSIDFNTNVINDLRAELSKRDEKIKELQDELVNTKYNSNAGVEQLNQYVRRNNVEVHGVPELQGEDVYELVNNIGRAVGCEINKSDVDVAHRLPTTNKTLPRPIVIKFVNRWKKEQLMAAKKQNRQLQSTAVGVNAPSHPIYINDHLTPKIKGLLKRAKDLRMKGYKFVWVRDGRVYVRKHETSAVILIKEIEDILRLEN